MEANKSLELLKEVRKNTIDPKMQKDLDNRIKALVENKTVNK